jgi:hypothetical protein
MYAPAGMAGWKIALIVGGSVAALGGLGFVGWKLYRRRKNVPATAPMSDYLCTNCSFVRPEYGP